ncbi:MAG: hypothetical protein ACE5LU_08825 [Anaerolineae bacterium]
MHKRKIFGKALFLALALSVLVVGTALADSRTVGDTTGVTIHGAQENYWAYTLSSSLKYWLWVNERAWGASPNPLKDEK